MPYTTLVAGTTITASWANANVRDQVVTPFATAAARDSAITSPVNGMVANITDDDHIVTYNGSAWVVAATYGAWNTYVPTLTQSGSVTHTASRARYVQNGKLVHVQVHLDVTGTGTAANRVTVTVPVTAAYAATIPCGGGYLFDTSANLDYAGISALITTTTAGLILGSGGVSEFMGATNGGFTAALASGDAVLMSLTYEAA